MLTNGILESTIFSQFLNRIIKIYRYNGKIFFIGKFENNKTGHRKNFRS